MPSSRTADVVIVGDGLIGLACGLALAQRKLRTVIAGRRQSGIASAAAAGLLAPTIDPGPAAMLDFALAARQLYPSFVDALSRSTKVAIPLSREGILRVAASEAERDSLAGESGAWARWLDSREVARLEPALHAPLGALWHHDDGIVDNQALLAALDAAVSSSPWVQRVPSATAVVLGGRTGIITEDGARIDGEHVVLAAGAWSPTLAGLPRPLPIVPLRGQMLALGDAPVVRPIYGFGGYLAPRTAAGRTIVGSTSENVGFSSGTTNEALDAFLRVARSLVPGFASAPVLDAWSGFRPMTPDSMPILGPEPQAPRLVYACGHSRNGVLMAPITGDVVTALVCGERPPVPIDAFGVSRFPPNIRPNS